MAVQDILCQTFSETPKTDFIAPRPKSLLVSVITQSMMHLFICDAFLDSFEKLREMRYLSRKNAHTSTVASFESLNPFITNKLSHHYHLEESNVILRDIRSDFYVLFHFQ